MFINDEIEILDLEVRKTQLLEITESENTNRRDEYNKRHEIYHDRQLEYVIQLAEDEGMGKEAIRQLKHRAPGLSILRKLINKKARVYAQSPTRNAETETQQQLVEDVADEIELDMIMKKTNRWLELHKNTLVHIKPMVDRDAMRAANGDLKKKIGLEVWNPAFYDVIPDPLDETKPLVIIFSYFDDQTASSVQASAGESHREGNNAQGSIAGPSRDKGEGERADDARFVWWSPKYNFVTDGKGIILPDEVPFPDETDLEEQVRNVLGRLPFINFCKDQNVSTYWAEGGEDLVDGATKINLLIADLHFIAKYQGMGILTFVGKDLPKSFDVSPHQAVMLEDDGSGVTPSVSYASSNPPIQDHIRMIEQYLAMLLTTNDLEPGAISGTLNANNANSGIQEIIQKSEPSSAIADDQAIFISREPEILEIVRAWSEALRDTGELNEFFQTLAGEASLVYELEPAQPEPFVSEAQRVEAVGKKLDIGVITKLDALKELNPDMTDEVAKKKLEEIKAEKMENAAAFGVPAASGAGDEDEDKPNPFEKNDDEEDEKDDNEEE